MHGPNGIIVLFANRLEIAASLFNVTSDATEDSNISICIDKDLHVELIAQLFLDEGQDALNDKNARGDYGARLFKARMGLEVIDGHINSLAPSQLFDVLDEQGRFERIRMVVVKLAALLISKVLAILIVGIVVNNG